MKSILIYRDSGAAPCCIHAIVESLKRDGLDQKYKIAWADRHLLSSPEWQKYTHVLIFPGGRDIPYHRALQGGANDHIRSFVLDGGKYFGICAGSYYGSSFIEFEKGGQLEVLAERDLKFFPGIARGPAYGNGKFCYHTDQGVQIAPLHLESSFFPITTSAAYYKGGCVFVDAENYENISVLGRYADIKDQPAAIIRCRFGAGEALLCGVHPEYSAEHEFSPKFFSEEHLSTLQSIELQRRQLFGGLMKILKIN